MKRILYLQYTTPAAYPPLQHSSRILARAEWGVLLLGKKISGVDSLEFPRDARIQVRQMPFCRAGWRQKVHYLAYCVWSLLWVLRWRPAWIYASDPLSCPIALLLSYWPNLKIIYHEHDSPTVEPGAGFGEQGVGSRGNEIGSQNSTLSGFMSCVLWARGRLAGRARLCVFPNQDRAARFLSAAGGLKPCLPRQSVVVWNCPSAEEVSACRDSGHGDELWLLYHGSIVPSRLPVTVLEALALLPETIKLRVVGYETAGHLGYVQTLRAIAARLGLAGRVEFCGAVPQRADLLQWCRQSDVGLAFIPTDSADINFSAMLGASNKPFDYLSSGMALLVSNLADWRHAYVDSGFGLACDPGNPESVAGVLQWFADHPEETRAMGERGRQRIAAEWNYETQFAPVLDQLQRERS